jgi:hypothetical protein
MKIAKLKSYVAKHVTKHVDALLNQDVLEKVIVLNLIILVIIVLVHLATYQPK